MVVARAESDVLAPRRVPPPVEDRRGIGVGEVERGVVKGERGRVWWVSTRKDSGLTLMRRLARRDVPCRVGPTPAAAA
jgi:hypothetical protein